MEVIQLPTLDVTQLILRIKAQCTKCDRFFVPQGMSGFSTLESTVEENEIRIPIFYPVKDEDDDDDIVSFIAPGFQAN